MYEYTAILCVVLAFNIVDSENDYGELEKKKERKPADYDWSVKCKYQPNSFNCGKELPRFYYDTKMEDCKTFSYGGCPTHFNSFVSLTSCHEVCTDPGQHVVYENLTDNVVCRLQPEFGYCHEYYPMWYYDINERACRGFSYSGCGGNGNRFTTAQICAALCGNIVEF